MILKLKDEFIRADKCIGPMPNFNETFEKFFIEKSAALIYGTMQSGEQNKDVNDPDCQYIVGKKCFYLFSFYFSNKTNLKNCVYYMFILTFYFGSDFQKDELKL